MFILDPFALATDGTLAPASGGGKCLQPFALASAGQFVIDVEALGLADPYVGPSRFNEPFDRGYYLWKYGDQVLEQTRPAIGRALLRQELLATRPVDQALAEARRLEDQGIERDLLELELYTAEVAAEILTDQVLSSRLADNLEAATEALLLLQARNQQRVRNQQAAAIAVINFYL